MSREMTMKLNQILYQRSKDWLDNRPKTVDIPLMPNGFLKRPLNLKFWPLLKIVIHPWFIQKKNLRERDVQIEKGNGRKWHLMREMLRTVSRQPRRVYTALSKPEQLRTVLVQSSNKPEQPRMIWTIFPRLLKHNDNLPLSIRADAINPHSAPGYRRTPDNNNNNTDNNINDKYQHRHQFKCFKSYRLNEKLWYNNSYDDRRKHYHDIYYLQVKGNIITKSWAAHFLLL